MLSARSLAHLKALIAEKGEAVNLVDRNLTDDTAAYNVDDGTDTLTPLNAFAGELNISNVDGTNLKLTDLVFYTDADDMPGTFNETFKFRRGSTDYTIVRYRTWDLSGSPVIYELIVRS